MSSRIFEIHELVAGICDAVPTYHDDTECGHFGLALDDEYDSFRYLTTIHALASVNKFIGGIASTRLWREPKYGFNTFFNVFPKDYISGLKVSLVI